MMHLYLEPMGGMAGDMFAAALLDAWPELEADLHAALAAAGLASLVRVQRHRHQDGVLAGSRVTMTPVAGRGIEHRTFHDICGLLDNAGLTSAVRDRTVDMFRLLAEAEGRVHGVAAETVRFHEVGAWDSIADIVVAAWLIDRLNVTGCSCEPLPMGRGRVAGAHGLLPVPAPATVQLLKGFPLFQDEHPGERITPTGAAILRHLNPSFDALDTPMTLGRCGIGFGTRTFVGMSNILRVLAFEAQEPGLAGDRVALCQFEVDDQSPEDLAVALEHLRALAGVLDVIQAPVYGKKGRLTVQVQILTRPVALDRVLEQCFRETSTLGVRWQTLRRATLARDGAVVDIAGRGPVRVKGTRRPGGVVTVKAEMDDLADAAGGHAGRERLRRQAEDAAFDTAADPATERKNDA